MHGSRSIGVRISLITDTSAPRARLALEWVYTKYPAHSRETYWDIYEKCFDETPPLNTERGNEWFEPPDGW